MAEMHMQDRERFDLEFQELKTLSTLKRFDGDSLIFTEGDQQDYFYIIESGAVAILIDKSGETELVSVLNVGSYFGEMAIFTEDKRTATAMALGEVVVSCVDKADFREFLHSHPVLHAEIGSTLVKRNETLLLKEKLVLEPGPLGKKSSVSFKGDPSLRQSAFLRERYESEVDAILPQIQSVLKDILLNRNVYRVFVNMNSGEIRTCSIFEPFREEVHVAKKLINKGYVDRHFTRIAYNDKVSYMRRVFNFIEGDPVFCQMSEGLQKMIIASHGEWSAVGPTEIGLVIDKLTTLRGVENFYLRNISMSILEDVVRMQFNCDGTHFVTAEGYQQFITDNL